MYFSLVILGIIAWIIVGFWPAKLAQNKGYNFFLFWILSWFISFFLTLLVVITLKDKTETPRSRADEKAVDEFIEKETNHN